MIKLKRVEDALFFLTLLFLPTQLGKHFWPNFSYIYSLKIDYLSPTVYFWDIVTTALLIVWLFTKPKINQLALSILLFFLFTQGLSLIVAENIGAGLVKLEQLLLAGFFGVYLSSQDFKNLAKRIYLPIALAVSAESIVAILQFSFSKTLGLWILGERTFSIATPAIAKFDFYGRQFLRPYATFPHPNVLAGFMLVTIAILAQIRKTPLVATFLAGVTIFLTMGRAAILAGFVSLILLYRKRVKIIIIVLIVLSPILFTRFSSIFNFDNLTLIRREELIEAAWKIFISSPVYGIGLNNFIPAMVGNLITGPSRFLQPVHNIFLLVLSETGIVGLVGFICLIGFPLLKLIKLYPKPYTLNPIIPWLIILFLGMFDHYFLTLPQGYRLLFLVWGLSFSVLK